MSLGLDQEQEPQEEPKDEPGVDQEQENPRSNQRTTLLKRAGRYHKVANNLELKEVEQDGKRSVLCYKPELAMRRLWGGSKSGNTVK